ncbi:hypothetical protein [Flavobacterium sp. 25HG05S-40]|uniref:hypothetical protein n=1 Tax=Flavobacterium sp. 25HG05S-40 TaxID=3458682 RepID=UPI0040446A53
MQKTKSYNGIDLLEKILEFIEMVPDYKQTTLNSINENKPRLIRLKRIESLVSAFFPENQSESLKSKLKEMFSSKKIDLDFILSGDFIEKRDVQEYLELINQVKYEIQNFGSDEIDIADLKNVFIAFVEYKKCIRKILGFNSGWLSVSRKTSMFTIRVTDSISSNLAGKYDKIDEALEILINPKRKSFTEIELISKFNFPKENLEEIDSDNW